MSERAYTTIDKAGWGPGPWTDEPDKVQWIDEATDLDCLVVRNHGGALCGYVGLPPRHPWHGVGYSEHLDVPCDEEWCYRDGHRPDATVEVHGGLTYAYRCADTDDESKGICHVPEEGRPHDVWWLGFDCAHAGDLSPRYAANLAGEIPGYGQQDVYRDLSYVRAEVAALAAQLAGVSS